MTKENKVPPLHEMIEQARIEWLRAQHYFNYVSDHDLIDYASYWAKAAERRYMYLLKEARREGVTYSPYE